MSILGIVTDEAQKARVGAVRQVSLCVGELAGVESTTLTACFEMLAAGTVADKARLVVRRIPATGTCAECGAAAWGRAGVMNCPVCRSGSVKLATGRELYVESIEVEQTQQG